ncbi:hypothetical protein DNTS_012343 [Danionella cerebrum]|uniref:Uncharacterized protein n=1 Tax=Danionella cerebrum TaxID=2873325 RepID=A0A553NKI4_9TELE|nr:hypothetical protein DNTS_012343 [Danionella translucida]
MARPTLTLPSSQQKPEDSYELFLIRVEYDQRRQRLMEELRELDERRFMSEINQYSSSSRQSSQRRASHLCLRLPPEDTYKHRALSRVPSATLMSSSSRYPHSDISWERSIIFTIASLVRHGDAQIAEKEQRKQREREEQRKRDLKLEGEKEKYNYWGRGGGGAPLKDVSGNLITDLKKHLRKPNPCESVARGEARPASPKKESASFSPAPPSSTYGRGNVFEQGLTPHQRNQDQRHRDFLKLQIEENKRRQEEEREKERMEEEREERRIARERETMKKEYEEELEKRRRKDRETNFVSPPPSPPGKSKTLNASPAPSATYGRGNVFEKGFTVQQRYDDQKHRDFLKLQIEEKKRRQEEEREKERIEEEKEERRIAKERETMKKEYEEELEKRRRKDRELEEARKRQIELRQKVKETETRRLADREELPKRSEPEKLPEIKKAKSITPPPSPPVPALKKKLMSLETANPTAGQICAAEKEKMLKTLSGLRKQLQSRQKELRMEMR